MKKCLVILASFNGGQYIKEQILSILNQVNINIDIIVFDDLSTDNTVDQIRNIKDVRLNYIINRNNTGSAAMNFFLAFQYLKNTDISEYDFVSLSDQDDIWMLDKINSAIKLLDLNEGDLYLSNLTLWNQNENSYKLLNKHLKPRKFDYLFEGGSAGCTYVMSKCFFIYITNLLDFEKFNNWKYISHDWFIYFQARLNNKKIVYDINSYINYRIHEKNVHGQLNLNNFNSFKKRYDLIKSGWFRNHINNYKSYFNYNSTEIEIYNKYLNSKISRLYILIKYNFSLIRSKRKFLKFFIFSLIE
jgi:rhamnosyltransferase